MRTASVINIPSVELCVCEYFQENEAIADLSYVWHQLADLTSPQQAQQQQQQ